MKQRLLACALALFTLGAHAAPAITQAQAETFLKQMAQLNHDFDPKYVELYADDAIVTGHKHETGDAQTLTGSQVRQIMLFNWERSKKRDDRFTLNKPHFQAMGERMKVSAERYVPRKCNTDPDYYLVLGRQADGRILIVEESFELSLDNLCK